MTSQHTQHGCATCRGTCPTPDACRLAEVTIKRAARRLTTHAISQPLENAPLRLSDVAWVIAVCIAVAALVTFVPMGPDTDEPPLMALTPT